MSSSLRGGNVQYEVFSPSNWKSPVYVHVSLAWLENSKLSGRVEFIPAHLFFFHWANTCYQYVFRYTIINFFDLNSIHVQASKIWRYGVTDKRKISFYAGVTNYLRPASIPCCIIYVSFNSVRMRSLWRESKWRNVHITVFKVKLYLILIICVFWDTHFMAWRLADLI